MDIGVSDKVPHYTISRNCINTGLQEQSLWRESWLKDQRQNGHLSGWRGVSSVFPQGMMLGLDFSTFSSVARGGE